MTLDFRWQSWIVTTDSDDGGRDGPRQRAQFCWSGEANLVTIFLLGRQFGLFDADGTRLSTAIAVLVRHPVVPRVIRSSVEVLN